MLDILSRPLRVQSLDKNTQAFLELVKAGLWEKEVWLAPYEPIDFKETFRLAQEQAVVGLVAAGLEYVTDTKIPSEVALTFAGEALQLEQRNNAMNYFIGVVVEKMSNVGISTVLVKGQGIAQCYERPMWRVCGDVDFQFSKENYKKAFQFLSPLASHVEKEDTFKRHQALTIDPWEVELHGSLKSGLWKRIDDVLDEVYDVIFYRESVRLWVNGNSHIFLPGPDEDVVYVFAHILQHFYKGGIGLRQICDWCRLLWKYREIVDIQLLEKRLRKMGLMTEWKAFSYLAVSFLNMSDESMPFYTPSRKWARKAGLIMSRILETGNFGHNRDRSYRLKRRNIIRKIITFWYVTYDMLKIARIFPKDSLKSWWIVLNNGLRAEVEV